MKYQSFKKYEKAWIDNKKLWLENINVEPPLFSIVVFELYKKKYHVYKVNSFDEFFEPDYIGYKWPEENFFIDLKGNKYNVNYIDMDHPVGFVFPEKIEKQITLSELHDLIKNNHNRDVNLNALKYATIKDLIYNL